MMYEIVGLAAAYMVIEFAKVVIHAIASRGVKEQMATLEKEFQHQMEILVRIHERQARLEPAFRETIQGLNKLIAHLEVLIDNNRRK